MTKTILAMATAIAALGVASQALADHVTVTYEGVVAASQVIDGELYPTVNIDTAGLFGGGNLEGYDMSAVFTYNTALGADTNDGLSDELNGGSGFDTTSPITSATFTINEITQSYSYTFTPDYYGQVSTVSPPEGGYVQEIGTSTDGQSTQFYLNSDLAPANLETSFTSTGDGAGYLVTGYASNADNLSFASYQVTVSATPEPASWALMIAGVGLVGAALRRRRTPMSPSLGA